MVGCRGSWREWVGQEARVQLFQVSSSSSMRGTGEVRPSREMMMHSIVTCPFKVFSQNLGTLLLINQPTSMRSKLMRAVKGVGHKAELLAYSRAGGSRGRSRWVVRCSCSSCYCSNPLCLQEALVLEQTGQMWIRSKGEVRV